MSREKAESPSPAFSANTNVTTPSPSNEFFDDVFGSTPNSPVLSNGNFAGPDETDNGGDGTQPSHRESSDVARLRSTHTKAGYRDGLAVAKDVSLQPGFDEGYSLGAALGLQAGLIIGTWESLWDALEFGDGDEVKQKFHKILDKCRQELQRQSLLADDYIDMEGLWAWNTPADASIHDVASMHPLIKIWRARMESMCQSLGIDIQKLEERWIDEVQSKKSFNENLNTLKGNDAGFTARVLDF